MLQQGAVAASVRIDSIDDELVLGVEPAEQPVPVT
jgi:hypothetical protein